MNDKFLKPLRDYIHRVALVPVGAEFEEDWKKVLAAVPESLDLESPFKPEITGTPLNITYVPPPIIPITVLHGGG